LWPQHSGKAKRFTSVRGEQLYLLTLELKWHSAPNVLAKSFSEERSRLDNALDAD
jgi:hypothetical protein